MSVSGVQVLGFRDSNFGLRYQHFGLVSGFGVGLGMLFGYEVYGIGVQGSG